MLTGARHTLSWACAPALAGARRLTVVELTEAGVGPQRVRPRGLPDVGDCIARLGAGQGVDHAILLPVGGAGGVFGGRGAGH